MAEEVASLVLKADATQVNSATKSLNDYASAGKNAEKSVDNAAIASAKLAKEAVVVGAAIAAVNTALSATRTFTDFSRAMTNVSTLIEGTADQMKALEAASISLGSRYGKMPVEQARTFYQVISSGITDVNKATDLLDSANKLSVAGFADLFATADSMTSIMNAYGDSIKSTADLSDILFVGTLAGKTTINELASSLGRVAPIAKELNVGIDELVGSIAALTLGGINTSEAITGVRAILAAVAKPSSEATKLAKQLGIEFDAAALKTKGMAGFLEDLKQKTGGSEQALGILFGGIEAIIPAMALAGEAGVKFNGIMKQMEDRAGATQTAFEKMEQSPGFKLDKLMANISAAGIKLGDILATVLLPIIEKVSYAFNKLFGSEMPLNAIDKQKQAIAKMTKELESMQNRLNIPVIGGLIFDKKKADQLSQSIEDSIADLKKLEAEEAKAAKTESTRNVTIAKTIDLENKLGLSRDKATKETKAYNVEIYKLKEAEKQLAGAKDIEYQKLKRHESALNEAKQLTEQTRTAQEKYNASIQRLNELRPYITADVYSKAVANARMELERADQTNKQFNENWQHAWSNMEQTGRMAFTQFAAHGVSSIESIGQALKLAVFDMLYQLTVRRWIINIGTSLEGALFGGAGGAVGASNKSGGGFNLFTGGFGDSLTKMLGNAGSKLPGSAGTFFGGMSGSTAGRFSSAGGAGTAFIGGSGTAIGGSGTSAAASAGANIGGTLSQISNIAALAFGLDAIGRMIGGNKKLGGFEKMPVLGGFLAGLFGRGPLKQKETTLSGLIGLEGFESGMLQTRFKASGSVFRSNKTDFARVDAITGEIWTDNQKQLGQFAKDLGRAAKDIFAAFNESAKESSKIINTTADNLGLSAESMKDFNYQLSLVSEKGKGLTEEQIAEEIEKMTTAMAEKFIPNIQELAKVNESAIEAISRLNNEFLATEQAARVLGMSLADAKVYAQGMGFELRTAFTDASGGVDQFNSKISFIAENFLTESERIEMSAETLNKSLSDLGVPLDITKDGFYQLIQSVFSAGDAVKFSKLLEIAPLFIQIANAADIAAASIKNESNQLNTRYLQATGNIVQLRKQELDALDPANRSLQEYIFALEDTAKINQEKTNLETKLLQLQGNTSELRKRELDALDPANQFLQRRIWQIEDERAAIDQANASLQVLKTNVSTAFESLQKSVEKERSAITKQYNKDLEESKKQIDSVSESINNLASLSDALRSATANLNPMSVANARAQIQSAISSGNLESPALLTAISALSGSGGSFATKIEAQRNQAQNLALLSQLNVVTDSQLLLDKRTLAALESARDTLEQIYNNEMEHLDGILDSAKIQIDALNNINNSILTIPAAIGSLNSAIAAQASAQASIASAISSSVQQQTTIENAPAQTTIENAPAQTTVTSEPFLFFPKDAIFLPPGGFNVPNYDSPQPIAKFDVGGKVPKTGMAIIHKDEQILTKNENESLQRNMEEMKKAIEVMTITQNKINRRFDKWDNEGLPTTRVA